MTTIVQKRILFRSQLFSFQALPMAVPRSAHTIFPQLHLCDETPNFRFNPHRRSTAYVPSTITFQGGFGSRLADVTQNAEHNACSQAESFEDYPYLADSESEPELLTTTSPPYVFGGRASGLDFSSVPVSPYADVVEYNSHRSALGCEMESRNRVPAIEHDDGEESNLGHHYSADRPGTGDCHECKRHKHSGVESAADRTTCPADSDWSWAKYVLSDEDSASKRDRDEESDEDEDWPATKRRRLSPVADDLSDVDAQVSNYEFDQDLAVECRQYFAARGQRRRNQASVRREAVEYILGSSFEPPSTRSRNIGVQTDQVTENCSSSSSGSSSGSGSAAIHHAPRNEEWSQEVIELRVLAQLFSNRIERMMSLERPVNERRDILGSLLYLAVELQHRVVDLKKKEGDDDKRRVLVYDSDATVF